MWYPERGSYEPESPQVGGAADGLPDPGHVFGHYDIVHPEFADYDVVHPEFAENDRGHSDLDGHDIAEATPARAERASSPDPTDDEEVRGRDGRDQIDLRDQVGLSQSSRTTDTEGFSDLFASESTRRGTYHDGKRFEVDKDTN
jgi:hypothetical protein